MPPNIPQCTGQPPQQCQGGETLCHAHINKYGCVYTPFSYRNSREPQVVLYLVVSPLRFQPKLQVCLSQLCKACLHPPIPQAIPLHIGQQGGVAGPSQMARCLLILHPGVTRSVSGSCGFSSPQPPRLFTLPWNPGVPKPAAGVSIHSSDGISVWPTLSKSLIRTRLAGPFFPYD